MFGRHIDLRGGWRVRAMDSSSRFSRRNLLTAAAAAGAGGLAVRAAAGRIAFAQTPLSPDEALKRLMDGNARFTSNALTSFNDNLSLLRNKTAEGQRPFAAVLSCADSRVPAEILFDQTIGHVFVCRVAGNIATPQIIGSLEFGTAVLGSRVLMVLGHGSCGAVDAAMANAKVPGQISGLYPYLRPGIKRAGAGASPEAAIRANAKYQAQLLGNSSPVLAGLVRQKKLQIVSAYYDLTTGRVSLL